MSSTVTRATLVAGSLAAAVAFRRQLVRLLTAATGTWIGSPQAPSSPTEQ